MPYRLATVDLSAPLPDIVLASDEDGVGIVIRRSERPIGFVLRALARGAALTSIDIQRLVVDVGACGADQPGGAAAARRKNHPPTLSVAVCTRNRPELLARCLASLQTLRQSPCAARVQLDILVVDNAPADDRTREVVAQFPGVRYLRAPVPGLDFARNSALREARGDFVAFFDDDVTVDARWLDGFVETCSENPDAGAITGPVLPYELATMAQVLFEQFGGFGHRFQKCRHEPVQADDPLYPCHPGRIGAGCNMTVRRSVVRTLGGFDEALDTGAPLPGGGDLDIFYRILRAGHAIATEPQCLVFHQHRRSYAELRHQMWTWGLGFMAFVTKSYRTDPKQRATFRRVVLRWFGHRLWHTLACATGRGGRPLGLAVAQLSGGVVGLFGEYTRSERRVRRLLAADAPTLRPRQEAT